MDVGDTVHVILDGDHGRDQREKQPQDQPAENGRKILPDSAVLTVAEIIYTQTQSALLYVCVVIVLPLFLFYKL